MKTQATQPKVQEIIQPKAEKQASIDTILAGYNSPLQRKSPEEEEPLQKKENNTGLPDNLKSGVESLSGIGLDDVKVHYNSSEPAQLQAHAYAQGTDIHVAPGQEQHLPHEAWHVVQQKQGRVKPTMQMKGKVNVNDDAGLETEADVMGAKAMTQLKELGNTEEVSSPDENIVQAKFVRVIFNQEPPGKKAVMPVTAPSVSSKAPSEESPIVKEETPTPGKEVTSGLKSPVPEASSVASTPVKGSVLEAEDDSEDMIIPPPPQTSH